ncbi:uncharacterized protein Dvar_26050 [Desulfosarcina variabilis str. Montpellier]
MILWRNPRLFFCSTSTLPLYNRNFLDPFSRFPVYTILVYLTQRNLPMAHSQSCIRVSALILIAPRKVEQEF